MKTSKKANAIEPSLSRELFNLARRYDDVIDLTLGDPDMPPNQRVRDAACSAVQAGKTRYSANAGILELREAIAESVEAEYGLQVDAAKEVVVTVGGMEALYLALSCMLDPGDEVLVQGPYYVNYVQMVRMAGGVPVVVESSYDEGFVAPAERWEQKVTDKTVAMVVNNPSNPSGSVMSTDVLDDLAKLVVERDLAIVSDEVYKTLVYDGRAHESVITRPGIRERAVLVDSASKRFAMTGYRLGWAVAPAGLAGAMTAMQENVAACASLPSQYAALEAYRSLSGDETLREVFERRRDCLCSALWDVPNVRFHVPQGAFYLFVDVSGTGLDGLGFAYGLLEDEHVAVVPGLAYGEAYGDYVRIAYTLGGGKLEEAARRIARFAAAAGSVG